MPAHVNHQVVLSSVLFEADLALQFRVSIAKCNVPLQSRFPRKCPAAFIALQLDFWCLVVSCNLVMPKKLEIDNLKCSWIRKPTRAFATESASYYLPQGSFLVKHLLTNITFQSTFLVVLCSLYLSLNFRFSWFFRNLKHRKLDCN